MRVMKDSGIPWIGEIPEGWNIDRLQVALQEIVEKNSPIKTDYILSLTNNRGVIPYTDKGDVGNKSKDNLEEYKVAYPNTIVANSMNILIGSVGICDYYGCVSPVYYVFQATEKGSLRFFNYIMSSEPFQKHLRQYANGILEIRLRLSSSNILKRYVPFPSLAEQQRIAEFLDRKCAEVDEIIALQEQIIEELKAYKQSVITEAVTKGLNPAAPMRDSGIEWIGSIPEHWEVKRLKNVADLNPTFNAQIEQDTLVAYMPMECLRNGIIQERIASYSEVASYTPFKDGDVVMAKVTPCFENGNIAVANNLQGGYGFGTSEIFVIRCGKEAHNKYVFYYLQSAYIKNLGVSSMTGTGGLKRVNPTILNNSYFISPSVAEQQAIADYLDEKCADIDSLIQTKQQKIDSLKGYKKSIIYEYVTGKREVNE